MSTIFCFYYDECIAYEPESLNFPYSSALPEWSRNKDDLSNSFSLGYSLKGSIFLLKSISYYLCYSFFSFSYFKA